MPAMEPTLAANPTIFGKILRGEIPCKKVFENEHVLAFEDIAPKAPIHILIIPKQHLTGLQAATPERATLLGHLLLATTTIAKQLGVIDSGFRVISNAGVGAGQEVFHLHLHLLANHPGQSSPLPGF
jgi:histidine triad (HIT) family protein